MSPPGRPPLLLLGLALLAASLGAAGAQGLAPAAPQGAGETARTGQQLPAPQWVGGIDLRGKAQLTWVRNPAFKAVRVYRREEGPGAAYAPVAETAENVWVDAAVVPGRTYGYRLAGIGADGKEGRRSSELAVRVAAVVLRPPEAPAWEGYLPVGDAVGLKWSAREGEDVIAWNVYRRTPPETEYALVGSSRGTSFQDVGLEPDRPYLYVLTALDSAFRESPFSAELAVTLSRPRPAPEQRPAEEWRARRTRLVALVAGGKDLAFERPADVAVGPLSGDVYVVDSGRGMVFVFNAQGVFQRTIGAGAEGAGVFRNALGLAADADENLLVVDAAEGSVQSFTPQGRAGRRLEPAPGRAGRTGLIDAAVGRDGRVWIVDNFNSELTLLARGGARTLGQAGARGGEFSAPTFCATDAAGRLFVSDCLNARVQVFSEDGEFQRAFGRAERGPGGFGRPKGIAVSAAGEVYVADSWFNVVQVFDAEGRFVAVLTDEAGRPLDLGSPNGVALGPGNRVYIAERLSARLQVRELIDAP